jgi:hypothetical protein
MTVEVALAPQNQAGLNSALQAIYTEGSSQYHQFLSAGQFDAQYAPSAAERASVAAYLAGEGLTVASTSSPFLLSVTGSSAKITAAFHTSLSNYVDPARHPLLPELADAAGADVDRERHPGRGRPDQHGARALGNRQAAHREGGGQLRRRVGQLRDRLRD